MCLHIYEKSIMMRLCTYKQDSYNAFTHNYYDAFTHNSYDAFTHI